MNRAPSLHDLATRAIPLDAEQQAELDAWYAEQDQAEGDLLTASKRDPGLAELRAQVDEAVTQLRVVTGRIQELAAQNETLRQEVAALQRQVARMPAASAS